MKNAAANRSAWQRFERDLHHDWDDWSPTERLAVKALTVSSALFAAVYFGLSALSLG